MPPFGKFHLYPLFKFYQAIVMNLHYTNHIDDSMFYVTDFNCQTSRSLLKKKGLYKIIWAKDNDINLTVDGYHLNLHRSQIRFCTPMNVIELDMDQNGIVSLVFNREFYCIRDHDREVSCQGILFYGGSQPAVVTLNEMEEEKYILMYQILLEEFETRDQIQGEMLRVVLKRILIKSTRLVKNDIPDPLLSNEKIDVIRRFNILVEDYYKEKHLVADYASMLHKSPKTLLSLFKKYNEQTPLKFINERILIEARRLLLFSDKTSEEIAYELGYREPGHFAKFFKKQAGMSPIEFRKKTYSKAS